MTYFAIIGKHNQISTHEMQLINPKNLNQINNIIITFDTDFPEKLNLLAGIIKRGILIEEEEIGQALKDTKLIGTADKDLGLGLKREFKIKRFKLTSELHTDKEVKYKGIEVIKIRGQYGIIKGYQNIELYEVIDFEKPGRSMQMGMMPAKLTHIMINIGLANHNKQEDITIFDPFAGSGTTGFLANNIGYEFIGTDIKTNFLVQNFERRDTHKLSTDKKFKIFKQDIFEAITNNVFNTSNILLVSEGWLGPIVNQNTSDEQIKKYQFQVLDTYNQLINQIRNLKIKTSVFTIPYYIGRINFLQQEITKIVDMIGYKITFIDEIYKRDNQKIGRQIVILKSE